MIEMVDSIESPETTQRPIPRAILTAQAVGAYIAGNSWPTWVPYTRALPGLWKLGRIVSITLTASRAARCLDVEPGGATNAEAPGWFRNLADHSQGKPILYTFASNVQALIDVMTAAGIARDEYLIWSAHFRSQYGRHMCGPATCGYPQADMTQWTDQLPGNCDGSICEDYCFPSIPTPPQAGEHPMISMCLNSAGQLVIAVEAQPEGPGKVGRVFHTEQDQATGRFVDPATGHTAWHELTPSPMP